ncbi:restriction endonuclease [Nocardia sp. NPDC051981]|uniref:restriction endonuclease n=1 Tax=Nocardia sp. NPDC051981 TaxID=3155417 RepID=UPI00343373ED
MIIAQPATSNIGIESDNTAQLHPRMVRPRKYQDAELRKLMGGLIADADDDALLAAYIWATESRIAHHVLNDLATDRKIIEGWVDGCTNRLKSPGPWGWTCTHTLREAKDLLQSMIELSSRTAAMLKEAEEAVSAQIGVLRDTFGKDPTHLYPISDDSVSPLDSIFATWHRTFTAIVDFIDSVDKYRAAHTDLEEVEARRAAYVASGNSISNQTIQRCDGTDFEKLTASLLRRDGLTIIRGGGGSRDQGADVIAVTPDGRRVVVQCKLRQRGPVPPAVLHQVNGTARQVHGADVPLVVTNSTFSAQATTFASEYEIHLIDDHGIRRWATWGESIYHILGLSSPPSEADDAA